MSGIKLITAGALLLISLTACQTIPGPFPGAQAEAGRIIRLDMAGAEVQQWQDLYLTIDSGLREHPGHSLLTGKIQFSIRPQALFRYVSEVTLWVFILDENNRVLSFQAVPRTTGHQLDDVVTFSTDLQVSHNAVAYTFGYDASFLDDQGIYNRYQSFPGNP